MGSAVLNSRFQSITYYWAPQFVGTGLSQILPCISKFVLDRAQATAQKIIKFISLISQLLKCPMFSPCACRAVPKHHHSEESELHRDKVTDDKTRSLRVTFLKPPLPLSPAMRTVGSGAD